MVASKQNLMKNIILFFAIIITYNLSAQEVHYLDLDKSIEIAKVQSFNMLILNKNLEQSEYQLKAATRRFRTKMDFNLTGPRYTQTIRRWEDSTVHFAQTNTFKYEGVLTLNQPLPTDGNIFISSGLYNSDNFNNDENSLEFGTNINFNQPLEALYAYNRIRSEFKSAELNYEATLKSLKRAELNLIYETSRTFYNLLSARERKKIAQLTLSRQQEAYKIAQNKFAAGLIREVEALQIEVDLGQAQNNLVVANSEYESQSNFFKQNLGLPLRDSIVIEGQLDYEIVLVDIDKAIQFGLNNRLEIRESEIDIELTKLRLKQQKSQGMIQGDIYANYGFKGAKSNPHPISFQEAFSSTYNVMLSSPDDYSFGINLAIPIIDWGENRARVKSIEANLEMNRYRLDENKVTIEREIRNTVNTLESALRRLQLLEKNVKLAEQSFSISEYRFQNGDIDSEAYALDRERLNNAKLSHLEAYISYQLTLADLLRKTFYDFQKDQPVQ